MRTRRAETDLTWNGAAVTSKMVGYKATVTYTDAGQRRGGQPGDQHKRPGPPMDHGMDAENRGHPDGRH